MPRSDSSDTKTPRLGVRIEPVGDSDAAIIERFEAAVRRFCRSRTRSEADAEDAFQDTFVRFLRRSPEPIRSHEAWLIAAASRACVDINRKRQRDERHNAGSADAQDDSKSERHQLSDNGADDPATLTANRLTVTALLAQLDERDRLVVTHLYLLGAEPARLAQFLGMTPNNLRQRAFHARRRARALLRESESGNATSRK